MKKNKQEEGGETDLLRNFTYTLLELKENLRLLIYSKVNRNSKLNVYSLAF
jgi:hypothetical protein